MLDLDGFKLVNDTYGHKVGDILLREVGKVMRAQLREYDFLARYAGDEFVAIVPDTTQEGIQELCQRLEKAVLGFKLSVGDGRFTSVGVSVGSAGFPKSGESLDQIIVAADKQMYEVKAKHKLQHNAPIQHDFNPEPLKPLEALPIEHLTLGDDAFVVELDESHIISNAVN